MLVGPDGCHYEKEAEALYFGQLGLCGCGCPSDIHKILIDCLSANNNEFECIVDYKKIVEIVKNNPETIAELILHFLDSKGLTEHGSSVYGSWITKRGEQFVKVGPIDD